MRAGLVLLLVGGTAAAAPAVRPVLTGPEQTHDTADACCKIHWTTTGDDAIPEDGMVDAAPMNGLPDAIDAIEAGLTGARQLYVIEGGWPMAPADAGTGGDDKLDAYVRKLDARGYAHASDVDPGRVDMYIEINPKTWPAPLLTSVAAHEEHHTMEYGLARNLPSWIYESSATWAQYRFISSYELGIARDVLWTFRLMNPEKSLTAQNGQLHYAMFIWWKFLIDRLSPAGGPRDDDLVRRAFVRMGQTGSWRAGLDDLLGATALGSVAGAFEELAEWQWYACVEDDGRHYVQDQLACAGRGEDARVYATHLSTYPVTGAQLLGIEPLAAGYLELHPDCQSRDLTLTVTPEATATGAYRLRLLEVPPAGAPTDLTSHDLPAGAPTTVTVPNWNLRRRVVAILVHLDDSAPRSFTYSAEVTGAYQPGTGPRTLRSLTPVMASYDLQVGDTLRPELRMAFGGTCEDDKETTTDVTWTTTDPSIVDLAPGGGVLARSPGQVALRAMKDGVMSGEITVRVKSGGDAGGGGCATGGGAGGGGGMALALALLLVMAGFVRRLRRGRPAARPAHRHRS